MSKRGALFGCRLRLTHAYRNSSSLSLFSLMGLEASESHLWKDRGESRGSNFLYESTRGELGMDWKKPRCAPLGMNSSSGGKV